MKVLVIGGTGWVGHNIALACSRAGFDTTVMSRNPDARFPAKWHFCLGSPAVKPTGNLCMTC